MCLIVASFVNEVESRVYNSEGTLVRYNGKHLADNNSQYQTNIVLQLSDNETVKNIIFFFDYMFVNFIACA
jgi:hypothetical protein